MGAKPVIARTQAARDVESAIDHYLAEDAADAALGFVDALERAYAHLGRQPATGSPRYGHALGLPGLRSWPLTGYPFLVFYLERADHMTCGVCCIPGATFPSGWRSRTVFEPSGASLNPAAGALSEET